MSMLALRWARTVGGISSTQKLVLLLMADVVNDQSECWQSAKALAADACLTDRAVRMAMDGLEQKGLIKGHRREGCAARWVLCIGQWTAVPAGGGGHGKSERRSATTEPRSALPEPPSGVMAGEEISPPNPGTSFRNPGTWFRSSGNTPRNDVPHHPGTIFRSTPEPFSAVPRNEIPETPERRSYHNPSIPKEPKETPKVERAKRLPDRWEPDAAGVEYARSRGLDALTVLEAFRDHWVAAGGQSARKLDWSAAWRTWCRNEIAFRGRRPAQRRNGFIALIEEEGMGSLLPPAEPQNPFLTALGVTNAKH